MRNSRQAWRAHYVLAAAIALVFASAGETRAQLERVQVGAWNIGSHFDGGVFSHCTMLTRSAGEVSLIFSVARSSFTLAIFDAAWNLPVGRSIKGYYQIDDGPQIAASGEIAGRSLLAFRLRPDRTLYAQFRTAATIRLVVVGTRATPFVFSIDGSAAAFDRLSACASAGIRMAARPPATPDSQRTAPDRQYAAPDAERTAPPAARSPERKEGGGTATGFFVTREGHILTANHVVRDCKSLTAQVLGEVPLPASVVATSRSDDLALLKTNSRREVVAPFRSGSPRLGEAIVVYGFPLQGMLTSSGNLTTGNIAALAGLRDDHRMLQFSAPVQPGNSGGPLLDLRGAIAGVVVSKLDAIKAAQVTGDIPQNINFAVKTSVVQSFLEAHGISITRTDAQADLAVADVAERARAFTVRIECSTK